jgi:hypothetical protein
MLMMFSAHLHGFYVLAICRSVNKTASTATTSTA